MRAGSGGHRHHTAAGLGAPAAGFRVKPAVFNVISVLPALSRAGIADLRTDLTYLTGKGTVAGHERYRRVAHAGAVPVVTDAVDHHLEVVFTKTGFCAGVASYGAILTGVNTIPVRLGG